MYFKKLELVGFKSFCNKTTLHFEPGITAVVGPNGCGKSNIFDSIRWVLGEQSVKSLRGSAMEDVIFNGTDSKEPLSMAEVSLTFDNTNKFFPVDHPEVAITRRIFRSGESEYLLNKTQVRLKDILDLLLGTGIGAESYSLIPQGKIDMILSSRPEDRRLVFDEASGVTKYKAQKREALRRLEETDQNLLRVNDIIVEVKRQIGSLERQANKARRYKEVFEELKSKEISLAARQKKELEISKTQISSNLNHLAENESLLIKTITEQETAISGSQIELKNLEESSYNIKNEIMQLENLISRDKEHINLNQDRISELKTNKEILLEKTGQAKNRLLVDEEKLNTLKQEYSLLSKTIEEKTLALKEKESYLNDISSGIKFALENIALAKKNILELLTRIANSKNEFSGLTSKQQIHLARKKRLELEKAKINEEKASTEINLNNIQQEVESLEKDFHELELKISGITSEQEAEKALLNKINENLSALEKQKLSLQSQKQFLEEFKTKYEGISESMNAVIQLDRFPNEKFSGLVIKIKSYLDANRIAGEAKPFDLDTDKINEKIALIEQEIENLVKARSDKESQIENLSNSLLEIGKLQRTGELNLANKKSSLQSILEQFNKIKGEEDLILLELSDLENEMSAMQGRTSQLQSEIAQLENEHKNTEESILKEQNNISLSNTSKEEILINVTQIKTELQALNNRITSDDQTLRMLEDRYNQDKDGLIVLEKQIEECGIKHKALETEILELDKAITENNSNINNLNANLEKTQARFQEISSDLSGVINKIDEDKLKLDSLKNESYELQIQNKDLDFKYLTIKERLSQAYKVDLDSLVEVTIPEGEPADQGLIAGEITKLKEKLDSYGSVNLVAIEEYDELKKRYDFLTQQQNDLVTAKEALHEAILKINRTTKKMFLETFEKVKVEFRKYFKLLFNGGDAQVYLIDENDPLESGIEIICRPPGKKLQNVLLLSGGEKSMSAIALIFAIFKIKPAPFCVLDEIDAALDEANVDRFGRALQEFANISQFIVITHNKKTIANADIMYGITMEESGVSKIVSVKFAANKNPNNAPTPTPVEPPKETNPDNQPELESV